MGNFIILLVYELYGMQLKTKGKTIPKVDVVKKLQRVDYYTDDDNVKRDLGYLQKINFIRIENNHIEIMPALRVWVSNKTKILPIPQSSAVKGVEMTGKDSDKNTIGLVLSIVLAAAVAHALNLLASGVDPGNNPLWITLSLIFIAGVIGIILTLIEIKEASIMLLIKSALIAFFSMFIFGVSRYLKFKSDNMDAKFIVDISHTSLTFLFLCGLVLVILGIGTYISNKKKWDVLAGLHCLMGIILIIAAILLQVMGLLI